MSRIRIRRDGVVDPRDKLILELQEKIDFLEHSIQYMVNRTHHFSLSVELACMTGDAAFSGNIIAIDVDGRKSKAVPVAGHFRSSRRKERVRNFSIPFTVNYSKKAKVEFGDPVKPEWQKRAEEEITNRENHLPEHILEMRRRRRRG